MRVFLADYDAPTVGYWVGKYQDSIGWLVGPSSRRMKKVPCWMPFACDNDKFIAYTNKADWNESAWLEMLSFYRQSNRQPMWVLVPDVVGDRIGTLKSWQKFAPRLKEFGWTLAFAAQDGMTPSDVPEEAEVVFVGGTTEWKWRNVGLFAESFPRVHVGRVNTLPRVWLCHDLGVESVDGTGWFRDGENNWRLQCLETYFKNERQPDLFHENTGDNQPTNQLATQPNP